MAYTKTLVIDAVVQRLIETQGIYSYCNRAYDGLVKQGATSVDIPKLADVTVNTSGVSATDSSRAKTKTDTTMVNVALSKAVVPLASEILGEFESNGMLLKEYMNSAALAFQQYFDTMVLTEALTTTNEIDSFSELTWQEITTINKELDVLKVPKKGRIFGISAEFSDDFYNIDVVKSAMAYNSIKLATGEFVDIMGYKFFISGLVPTSSDANQIVAWYGPGLAFILSRYMELKTVWDTDNLIDVNDLLCHFGKKLLNVNFAVKGKEA